MESRLPEYDIIRSLCIITVFFDHLLNVQLENELLLTGVRSLSPGLTMSLFGFISAVLLTQKYRCNYDYKFYVSRITRIYCSLTVCLAALSVGLFFLGYDIINQHSILHFMGFSAFFTVLQVQSKSPLGPGLWFVTCIVFLYFLLPVLSGLLSRKNGFIHLLIIILCVTFLEYFMYSTSSIGNVIISFTVGVYIGVNDKSDSLKNGKPFHFIMGLILVLLCYLATANIIPYYTRILLFAFYPLAFVPALHKLYRYIPKRIVAFLLFFSTISFEFYIIHSFFINSYFTRISPQINSLAIQVIISFLLTTIFSFFLAKISTLIKRYVVTYLI